MEDDAILQKLNSFCKADLQLILDNYNWDDGFAFPELILKSNECDFSLAMEIFNLADGTYFLMQKYVQKLEPSKYEMDWWNFCD